MIYTIPGAFSSLGEAALAYSQELGWPLFPLVTRGKRPRTANGFKSASSHPERIVEWWARWPYANLALATGRASGIVVVDVDSPTGELQLEKFGPLPPTPTVATGKGRHLYFSMPPCTALGSTRARLGVDVDTRADGGYIVLPPSVHPSGRVYEWATGLSPVDVPFAPLPDTLLTALSAPAAAAPVAVAPAPPMPYRSYFTGGQLYRTVQRRKAFAAWLSKLPTGLSDGQGRNDAAYRIAARAIEAELSASEVVEVLRRWNAQHVEPLDERALLAIATNAGRHRRGA